MNRLFTKGLNSSLQRGVRSVSVKTGEKYFDKILIANRGEIACRVMRTCKRLGIKTVAVHSEADANAMHVRMADERYCIGPAPSSQSYLVIDRVIEAVEKSGAQAVHPGYGFLSEKSAFCHRLDDIGVKFIGPKTHALQIMGDKLESKQAAHRAKVNTIPGFKGEVTSPEHAVELARQIGYPVMVKAAAGGGGKGMRLCWNDEECKEGYRFSRNEAKSCFADDRLLIEKFIEQPRHIEVQVIGDSFGNVVYLNERECSIQRRNQKVLEEAPSTFIDPKTRKMMGEQAVALAKAVQYESAGTCEMLVDPKKNFYFLEMNTRLQVEHPITECITGVDIVEQMIRVAAGKPLSITQDQIGINGWALEARVYAEDPYFFLPSIGRLTTYIEPKQTDNSSPKLEGPRVRVDSGVYEGGEINMYYDPMICKLVTHAKTRGEALKQMEDALDSYVIKGVKHNIPLLRDIISKKDFIDGNINTGFIPRIYPDGFKGYQMSAEEKRKLFSGVALMYLQKNKLDTTFTNVQNLAASVPVATDLVITIEGRAGTEKKDVTVEWDSAKKAPVAFTVDGVRAAVSSEWNVGTPLFHGKYNSDNFIMQHLERIGSRIKVRYCGTELDATIRTKQEEDAFVRLPPKAVVDRSNELLTPMPGTIVSLSAVEGQDVLEGSEVAVMEAMKMQNKLLAPKSGKIKKVHAKVGDKMDGDQLIIEFFADEKKEK